ncbi:MAG: hypothetical protein ACPGXL_08605 [Chitinophagales bacterium]
MLDFLKNLFNKEQQAARAPIVQELLKRSANEIHAYEAWKVNNAKDYVLEHLKELVAQFDTEAGDNTKLMLLNNAKSRGFILNYDPLRISKEEFQYLFDYLKAQILKLNYKSYVSDVKNFVRKQHVEKIERHYLKPRLNIADFPNPLNQAYGNITIEQILYNEKPQRIKFLSTPYTDRKYTVALPFEELLQKVLV